MYVCRSRTCPGPKCARDQSLLDEYVIGRVLGRLTGEEVSPVETDDPTVAVRLELAGVTARLEEIEAELTATSGGHARAVRLLTRSAAALEERAEQLRTRLAAEERRPSAGLEKLDRAGWDALPLDRRRAVVRDLYEVVCRPTRRGPGFDSDAVELLRRAK